MVVQFPNKELTTLQLFNVWLYKNCYVSALMEHLWLVCISEISGYIQ